ncbi:hypothetical protein CPAV1605_1199 [seawater metagenome]|uniref:Uncharacterized protein n=1 Tax=seawater metagenome TaxID=1561972 RepID=A0A5E8CJD3_9ZZZZ
MISIFIILFSLLNMKFVNSEVISPINGDVWNAGSRQTISWNNAESDNLHISLRIFYNNQWNQHDSYHNDFLSLTVDSHLEVYRWDIPFFLSTYWEYPMKVILTELNDGNTTNIMESGVFRIPGITIENPIKDVIYNSDEIINISWKQFNANNKTISLYDSNVNIYSIETLTPIFNLANNCNSTHFIWIPGFNSEYDDYFKIVVRDINNVIGISDQFYLQLITTTPTSTPTRTPTTSPTTTPTRTPTTSPTTTPTRTPTTSPTSTPTRTPTTSPTTTPTRTPTTSPTTTPTTSPIEGINTNHTTNHTTEYDSPEECINDLCILNPPFEIQVCHNDSIYGSACIAFCYNITDFIYCNTTLGPTNYPTLGPTSYPTLGPTSYPTLGPTNYPTLGPTNYPTLGPTNYPTLGPTSYPTLGPTNYPSSTPSIHDTLNCITTNCQEYPEYLVCFNNTQYSSLCHANCYNIYNAYNCTTTTSAPENTHSHNDEEISKGYWILLGLGIFFLLFCIAILIRKWIKNKKPQIGSVKVKPIQAYNNPVYDTTSTDSEDNSHRQSMCNPVYIETGEFTARQAIVNETYESPFNQEYNTYNTLVASVETQVHEYNHLDENSRTDSITRSSIYLPEDAYSI